MKPDRIAVMKRSLQLGLLGAALAVSGFAPAHDVPNMEHTHAFKQTGYGTYRQGHSVNGPQGSITIYSPRTYGSYSSAPPVNFARPKPITRPPGQPTAQTRAQKDPARIYGRKDRGD